MASQKTSLRVCLLQFAAQENLTQTLNHLEQLVSKAVNEYQPRIIALPECFNFNYCADAEIIKEAAESINDGPTGCTLSKLSKEYGIFIIGSLIERDGDNLHNTSTVWDPNGELIARHRKVHLCNFRTSCGLDVNEADKLVPGNEITIFQVDGFTCGIAICKDAFFDEFIKIYGKSGCDLMFFPAAFQIHSGEPFWELVHRARAMDNQFYAAAISPARNEKATYVVFGHSMIIDPIGNILTQAGTSEEIVFREIDLKVVQRVRKEFLLYPSRRPAALYPIPCPNFMVCAFIAAVNIYMYVFGVLKSFSLYRFGLMRFLLCALGAVCVIPINLVIENVAVIWGLIGKKHKFYVVQKDVRSLVTV